MKMEIWVGRAVQATRLEMVGNKRGNLRFDDRGFRFTES